MPKSGINLITQESRERVLLAKIKANVNKYLTVFIVIFVIISLGTLLSFLFLSKQIKNNQAKIASLKDTINGLSKTESYLVTIDDRVSGISSLMKERNDYSDKVSLLANLYVPGFIVTSFQIERDGGIKIDGKCQDIQALTNFNERLEEIRARDIFSIIIYPQVTRIKDGKYNLSLQVKK